jgi:hypothetical protein
MDGRRKQRGCCLVNETNLCEKFDDQKASIDAEYLTTMTDHPAALRRRPKLRAAVSNTDRRRAASSALCSHPASYRGARFIPSSDWLTLTTGCGLVFGSKSLRLLVLISKHM